MLGIGLPELFVLAILALIVFGPDRLPDMASKAAKAVKALRASATKAMNDLNVETEVVTKTISDLQAFTPRAILGDVVGGVMSPRPTAPAVNLSASGARQVRLEPVFDPDAT